MINFTDARHMIASAWRKDPIRFAWMISGLLASNPLFSFQAFAAFANPSWTSLSLLPISLILGHLVINIEFMASRVRSTADILLALETLRSAGIQGYTISAKEALRRINTFSYDIGDDIEKWLFRMNGLNNFPLDYHIRIHVIPGSGSFSSYTSGPGLPTRIFVSNHPRNGIRHSFQKFLLLHEIMHAVAETGLDALERFSLPIFGLLALWVLPITGWNLATVIAAIVTISSILLLLRRAHTSISAHPASREMQADALAIGYLDAQERTWVHDAIKGSATPILCDDALSDTQNTERLTAFVRHLQSDDGAVLGDTFDEHRWRRQWPELPFLIGVAFLAGLSTPQDGFFLLFACITSALCFFGFLSLIHVHWHHNARIDKELSSTLPSSGEGASGLSS